MSATRDDLRHLVDEISEDRIADAVALLRQFTVTGEPVNELPFAGIIHSGHGELAERAEEILREEFGRPRS